VVKFSCQSKMFWMFGSNSKFVIPIFWIIVNFGGLFLLHTVSFAIKKFQKVAHTCLVCMAKISYQSKKLWVTEEHFSRRFNLICVFCNFFCYFLTFQTRVQSKHSSDVEAKLHLRNLIPQCKRSMQVLQKLNFIFKVSICNVIEAF